MKFNWYQVVVLVLIVVATAGWIKYAEQRNAYQELYAQQPTPPPSSVVYGLFEKIDGNTMFISVLDVGDDTGTLVRTTFQLATDVSVLRRDTQNNEYVASQLSELEEGTWLQLGTDPEGIIVSVTVGQ